MTPLRRFRLRLPLIRIQSWGGAGLGAPIGAALGVNMGLFDRIVDAQFKTDDYGNDLFFPYGFFGAGYYADKAAVRPQARRILMSMAAGSLFFGILTAETIGFWMSAVTLTVFAGMHFALLRRLTLDANKSPEPLRLGELLRRAACHFHLSTVIFWILAAVSVLALGVRMMRTGETGVAAAAVIFLGGVGVLSCAYMIHMKTRDGFDFRPMPFFLGLLRTLLFTALFFGITIFVGIVGVSLSNDLGSEYLWMQSGIYLKGVGVLALAMGVMPYAAYRRVRSRWEKTA